MLKKTLISLAIAAKTLAIVGAALLYAGSTPANAEDCPFYCVPPPCQENCEEES